MCNVNTLVNYLYETLKSLCNNNNLLRIANDIIYDLKLYYIQ